MPSLSTLRFPAVWLQLSHLEIPSGTARCVLCLSQEVSDVCPLLSIQYLPRCWVNQRLLLEQSHESTSEGCLLSLSWYTVCRGPNLCWWERQEAAVYLLGSGWVMCLCKHPCSQVSGGAMERENTHGFLSWRQWLRNASLSFYISPGSIAVGTCFVF